MRHFRLLPQVAVLVVTAVIAAGCGLRADPVVGTSEEVVDALLELQDGARMRASADLDVDEDELRDVLRDDPAARELVREALDGEAEDVDALLADLEEARARLADHAVLLAMGADGSARVAAEYRSSVWADLRVGSDLEPGDDPASGFRFDLQLQIDWATAVDALDQPDLLGDLDEAAAEIAPFLGDMPDLQPVQELLLALLGGELVGVGGELTPELLGGLGLSDRELSGAAGPGAALGLDTLDLDPRGLTETAFTFDGYRRDGESTLVDVTLEVRALGDLVLDQLAEAPDAARLSFGDVEELRADLAELPERLVDVATLRLDDTGTLQQVRLDMLDAGLQLAQAAEPDDEDLATMQRMASQLDATGLFVVADVTEIGQVETVLGDPTTAVTPEELATAFGALLFGGLGGELGPGAFDLETPDS